MKRERVERKRRKTAVVYDKWLRSLGGGEVVACSIAKLLYDKGYKVTFISGKQVSKETIKEKLDIDLKDIDFIEAWNEESKIRQICKGKDLFVNTSFMDYTFGYAKRNIYYTHFPEVLSKNLKGKIFTTFLLPLASKLVKPVELLGDTDMTFLYNYKPAYLLRPLNNIAISFLNPGNIYFLEFSLFLESFSKLLLESLDWEIVGAKIIDKQVRVDHYNNQINFQIKIEASLERVYLKINLPELEEEQRVFLMYPQVKIWSLYEPFYKLIYQRINSRLRAGVFANCNERLATYDLIIANSAFTKKWIKNYWNREAEVIHPPVKMLFKKHKLGEFRKKKWICSVGRFFKLGHGKKQEVLIQAFQKLYDAGYKDWELHLVGGVGSEPSSIEFVGELRELATGYPIHFHFNASRDEVEEIYLRSKIYWHAAGYGENENKDPIKFEHFGISTVEAMSAGCVPVVIKAGGQTEIVTEDCGYLWKTKEELVLYTDELIKKPKLIETKRKNALERGRIFSLENFRRQFLKSI